MKLLVHGASETKENSHAKDIGEFETQTNDAKGYYIGRFEMGQGGVCKIGVKAYNSVKFGDARDVSRNLYNDIKKGGVIIYKSDLINSYAWDTAIVYIMRTTGVSYGYIGKSSVDLKYVTGSNNDVYCNIYDMAGNVNEWTTEYSNYGYGTNYVHRGEDYTKDRRCLTKDQFYNWLGFRPILYVIGRNGVKN